MGEERIIPPCPTWRRRELEILDEIPNSLGLVLWQALRHVRDWSEATPHLRTRLFNPTPPEHVTSKRSEAYVLAPELRPALTEFWAATEHPLSVSPDPLASACCHVACWAAAREHGSSAIEWAETAAVVDDRNPLYPNLAGRLTRADGAFERSEIWFRRAIGIAREQNDKVELVRAHLGYGTLCKERGETKSARKHLNCGSRLARKHGSRSLAAEAQHDITALLIASAQYDEAEKHASRALTWYGRSHSRIPYFAADVALLMVLQNDYGNALKVLRPTWKLIEKPAVGALVLALCARALAGAGRAHTAETMRRAPFGCLRHIPGWKH